MINSYFLITQSHKAHNVKLCIKMLMFFLIGNQRTIINEKKWKVQVVHDDEQQETEETNSKTKEKEIRKIN